MKGFVIDREPNVTALDGLAEGEQNTQPEGRQFSTIDELAEMTRDWPLTRLVAMWNGLPGVRAVRKFTDRKTAVTRIWKALNGPPGSQASQAASAKSRRGKRRKPLSREGSKKARILSLLRQRSGATLQDLMRATGWQAHSVRGFISGNLVKRMGLQVNSARRSGGERSYRITKA